MTPPSGVPPVPAAHDEDVTAVRHRGRVAASVLIGLFCFVVYNANMRSISAGDTYPSRYLPFSILQHGTIYLNPVAKIASQGRADTAYWMLNRPEGKIISLYPVALPVLVTPLYLPAIGYLHFRGSTDAQLDHVAKVMEKLTASFLAALSAALLYLLLCRRTTAPIALWLTLAYAFGTTTWVISSQALWQHGLAELTVIGALLDLTAPSTASRTVAAGLLLGLIAAIRPPDVILAAALGAYGLIWAGRRRAVLLAAAAALPMIATLLYNIYVAGHVGGGYGVAGRASFLQHDLLTGLAGLLVSPTRGLLVFSPFLLFLVLAWRHLPRSREERVLTLAMSAGVAIQILLYAKSDWRSGLSWGPRYMTDLLPFLIWMLVPVVAALRGVGRVGFFVAVGVAVAIQSIGAFSYFPLFDRPIFAADGAGQDDMKAAFAWRNAPFLTSLGKGVAPPDLSVPMRGHFDAIVSDDRATTVVTAGQSAFLTGWALAGDATPFQVAVIVDGRQTVASSIFFDRPDVRAALNTVSPTGWRIPLDTAGLAPGVHRLTAMAWAFENGQGRYIEERELTVLAAGGSAPRDTGETQLPADLDDGVRTAAARLREHQHAQGYWLTTFTSGTRFHEPRPEMNTFLTALVVDLLSPLAASSGFEETLQRARRHLTSQIESGGLVRYHGLPDGPGIGTLGCAITPDSDNTALVWRIAPDLDRARMAPALATLAQFRTGEGLYRTWLAPRDAFECIDPGRDPNPPDIVIQMHLLQFLSEVQPAAGRALCEVLRSVVDEDRVWVYYQKTPLIAALRMTDLDRAGCTLRLPASRMRTDVPDQQIWLSVAGLLNSGTAPGSSPFDPALIRAVLREIARDDFALVRMNPPLLYHNDLTASVSRYYWSEDVGYALWLRLYDRYQRASSEKK
jgi:hypothetical protein